jgi:hypothetical protein
MQVRGLAIRAAEFSQTDRLVSGATGTGGQSPERRMKTGLS